MEESCPVIDCASRFDSRDDRNEHLLGHFNEVMVCGFCTATLPEGLNHFRGLDSFQRHLLSFHLWDVGQTTVSSYWSALEQRDFPTYVEYFGKDFAAIARNMGTKNPVMVKNYFARRVHEGELGLERSALQAEESRRREGILPTQDPLPPSTDEMDNTTFSQPAPSRSLCTICQVYFVDPRKMGTHLKRCLIVRLSQNRDNWAGTEPVSSYLSSEGNSVVEMEVEGGETSDADSISDEERLPEDVNSKSESAQSVPQALDAEEQASRLFVNRTISQDLTRGEEANTSQLLCALQGRPSGLRTESGGFRISSKRLFAEESETGARKVSKRLFAEERNDGTGNVSKRLFAEEGGIGEEKRRKFYFR